MHYFDLLIRLKTEQEHLFRNIQRNEYHNLFDFIRLDLSLPLYFFHFFRRNKNFLGSLFNLFSICFHSVGKA